MVFFVTAASLVSATLITVDVYVYGSSKTTCSTYSKFSYMNDICHDCFAEFGQKGVALICSYTTAVTKCCNELNNTYR